MPINDGSKLSRLTPYSEAYTEQCFVVWYSAGCPDITRFMVMMPKDERGTIPHKDTVLKMVRNGWRERADMLNAEVAKQIEKRAVEIRVEMLNRQADIGKQLQDKGMAFLDEHEFSKAGEALKAVISGAELERSSRGLPDAILKIAELKDEELGDILTKLLNKANEGGELEEVLNFDIEAQFKETTEDAADKTDD